MEVVHVRLLVVREKPLSEFQHEHSLRRTTTNLCTIFWDVRRPVTLGVRPPSHENPLRCECLRPIRRWPLASGLALAGREPIFSILGDPVPRSGLHVSDQAMLAAWRVIARLVLYSPEAVRDAAGAAVATLARPVDALLRRAGLSRGVNLELALFTRRDAARPSISGG